jgi:putative FmdB family regulatory protein
MDLHLAPGVLYLAPSPLGRPAVPIYEYVCQDCRRRVSLFWWTARQAETETARCPRCGRTRLVRIPSRVTFLRSEEDRLESLLDPSHLGDIDEDDPRSVARWMKRVGRELGDELGEDWDEMVEQIEAEGEAPGEAGESDEGRSPSLGSAMDAG